MYRLKLIKHRVFEPELAGYDTKISGPESVAALASKLLSEEDQEVFLVFALDIKHKVKGFAEVARGGMASCDVDLKVVFRYALLTPGCCGIVVAHNHPSGDTTPSTDDERLTRRLVEAGKMLGLTVVDHVIVGGAFYSFKGHNKC